MTPAPSAAPPPDLAKGIVHGAHRVRRRRHQRSAATASFLSFLWPGLGNVYLGQRARGAVFALPPLFLLMAAAITVAADPGGFAVSLLAPSFALLVIAGITAHAVWRVAAIFDAWRLTRDPSRRLMDRTLPLAVLLGVLVLAVHLGGAVFVQSFANAGDKIFTSDRPQGPDDIDAILGGDPSPRPGGSGLPGDTNGDGVVDWNDDGWVEDVSDEPDPGATSEPDPDFLPGDTNGDGVVDGNDDNPPAPSFDPTLTPPPFPDEPGVPPATDPSGPILPPDGGTGSLPASGPINVLFIGLDSSISRNHSLSDTIMLASYFPDRGTVTMISIPRDMGNVPLYKGGIYPRRMNTFMSYARANPQLFPEGPVSALMREVGYLLGTTVHFYAATNLDGMPRAVDAVGGVTITVTKAVDSVKWNYHVAPGTYHWNGAQALMYARVRYGSSDFARARRQQQVIRALALRVRDPAVALNLPSVIDALSVVVRTNVPRSQATTLLRIIEGANDASARNFVLSPSRYARGAGRTYYMIEPNIAAIRELSIQEFGQYSRYR